MFPAAAAETSYDVREVRVRGKLQTDKKKKRTKFEKITFGDLSV